MAHSSYDEQLVASMMWQHIAGLVGGELARQLDDLEGGVALARCGV